MSIVEVAMWFAVWAFLVIRVAMLVAFVALPVAIVKMVSRHSSA